MIALVTGNRGYIGSHLVEALLKDERFTKIVGANRRCGVSLGTAQEGRFAEFYIPIHMESWVDSLFRLVKPDVVFHLGNCPKTAENNFKNNVDTTYNVVKNSVGRRVIYGSSCVVYGPGQGHWRKSPTYPKSMYAAGKLASEALVRSIGGTCVRLSQVVGPNQKSGLLHDILKQIDNDVIQLKGVVIGSIRKYVHIDDVVTKLIEYAVEPHALDIVDLNPFDAISVRSVAKLVCDTLNINPNIELDECTPNLNIIQSSAMGLEGYKFKYQTSKDAIVAAVKEHKFEKAN